MQNLFINRQGFHKSAIQAKQKLYAELKMAILFGTVFSTINLLNNSLHGKFFVFSENAILNMFLVFSFLVSVWMFNANSFFYEPAKNNFFKKYYKTILINLVFSISLASIIYVFSRVFYKQEFTYQAYFLILIRAFTVLIPVFAFQYAFKSSKFYNDIALQNEKLKTENIRAQFEVLKQQTNPHFLFNALVALQSMIRSSDKNAEEYVLNLSEMYRQLLKNRDKITICLAEEISFADAYLFMLRTRFEERLSVEKNILENAMQKQIPAFCTQILLENCIKHNAISTQKPLLIKIYQNNPNELIIENHLQSKKTQAEPSGFGLMSLEKQYTLLGVENGVTITQNEDAFIVKLKLLDNFN